VLFYGAVGVALCMAIFVNGGLITSLAGIFYETPILSRLWRHAFLLPAIAINVVLALAAVAVYRSEGIVVALFVIAGVFVFAYIAKRLTVEREQRTQIEDLARSRGRLVAQLLETEDRERRALAEALHDDVIQTLLVTRQDLLDDDDHAARAPAVDHLDDAISQIRGAIIATHPSVLQRIGLKAALTTIAEQAAARGKFTCEVHVDEEAVGISDRLLFSSARELLANAARHSRASSVALAVSARDGDLILSVNDDGVGFARDLSAVVEAGHIGIHSLCERIQAVGGDVSIQSSLGSGTRVLVKLPAERGEMSSAATSAAAGAVPIVLTSVREDQ
jgi:two-component system NarL family sensor kinase